MDAEKKIFKKKGNGKEELYVYWIIGSCWFQSNNNFWNLQHSLTYVDMLQLMDSQKPKEVLCIWFSHVVVTKNVL